MSWPVQNTGQWNPGMMMAPDMNMGTYTPEQWAAMQQQNWQQWTQWQQQYAQWQTQYGEKYAEQMQAIQAMGGMPPLPPVDTIPPPAPPPPENPPPPPHENNQPLYGKTPTLLAPVPAPNVTQQGMNSGKNVNVNLINQQPSNAKSYPQESTVSSVNAEALKKLAEEERLFDIQFQKWEEEIEKWKKDNVNHPDKQAYKEYEQKFEACRAQLLERRQQMNKKKARLLESSPLSIPPPPSTTVVTNVNNTPSQSQVQNAVGASFLSIPPPNFGNNSTKIMPNKQQHFGSNSVQNYSTQSNNLQNQSYQNQQQYNMPPNQNAYKRSNNVPIKTDGKYQYSHRDEYPNDSFTGPPPSNPSFLLASESNKKGIPGLDLVPETDKFLGNNPTQEVIDITEDAPVKGPDYSTISKGINNILGDEKIMNILSMVRGHVTPNTNNNKNAPSVQTTQSGPYASQQQSIASYNQGYNNQNYNNQQFDDRQQNNMQHNSHGGNHPMHQNNQNLRHPPQNRNLGEPQNVMLQNQYDDYSESTQYGGNNVQGQIFETEVQNSRPNMTAPRSAIRPLLQDLHGPNDYKRGMHNNPSQQNTNDIFRGTPVQGQQNVTDYSRRPPGPMHQNEFPRGPVGSGKQQNVHDYLRTPPGPSERRPLLDNNIEPIVSQPVRPKWVNEPMFNPSLIVEYEHKPLRLKARDFIEPVHMFDYNHISKDEEDKKKDFEKEVEEIYTRKPRRSERDLENVGTRYNRDYYCRDFERRAPREDMRDEIRTRFPPRDDYDDRRRLDDDKRRLDDDKRRLDDDRRRPEDDRRRLDNRFDDKRRDDRDKYMRRDDMYRDRDKDLYRDRDRGRGSRRDDRIRSRSRDRDSRKRELSRENEVSDTSSKRSKDVNTPPVTSEEPKHVVMIDDLLELPGREMRPQKIVIILRGPPGSGKSFLAKLIRDKEAEHGGTVRIMSIDDYYMQEGEVEEQDPTTGKMVKKPTLKYEYDESSEETYISSLKRAFKRCLTDGYFTFVIYDAVNDTLKSYADIWNISRQNDFQVYICTMEMDPQICYKRNIHNRKLSDIEVICARFFPTPRHHIQLDATTLLQSGAITEVHMEDADDEVIMEDAQDPEPDSTVPTSHSGPRNYQWRTTYS